jgi:HAD superfamily hydrolase (TIGR01509 family)
MNNTPYFTDHALQERIDKASLVVFDMNGLIIDDESVQFESVNQALEKSGICIAKDYWTAHCVGKRADEFFMNILRDHGKGAVQGLINQLVSAKNSNYHRAIAAQVHSLVRPGVLEFIAYLNEKHIKKLALCTSALPSEIETVLGTGGLNLKDLFSYIVSGKDVAKSKPHPEIYLRVSECAGLRPTACLVFEDSGVGVQSAKRAGMSCIAIPNDHTAHQDFSSADMILDSLRKDASQCTIIRR